MDDDAIIAAAQRRLYENRGRIQIDTAPPQPCRRGTSASAPVALGSAVDGSPEPVKLVPAGAYTCNGCGRRQETPGWCAICLGKIDADEQRVKARARLIRIPEEYRQATFAALEKGLPSRGGGTRVKCSSERLRRIRSVLDELPEGGRVVLCGEPGGGKSTIAGAWLRGEIMRGVASAWWVAADDLEREEAVDDNGEQVPLPRDLLRMGESVVLDDLGSEIGSAGVGTGLAAQRSLATMKLLAARHTHNRGRLVITTNFTEAQIAEFYLRRIHRRIFEGAIFIDLEGT